MTDDIDKIRRNWRTNKVFAKFSHQVESMTNPKLKSLKEGMVEVFLKKKRSQVQKHNKRYVLTQSIIRSVFANWQTGQVDAQLLKGGEPSLSVPFSSELHDREINCEKFYKFIQDGVPLTVLEQLRTNPAMTLQQEAIDKLSLSSGLNIWDRSNTNPNAHLFQKRALEEYAAHVSTQPNNERLVKLGASTGKSEIGASVFAMASNDFMQEYHKTHQEPANQPAEAQTAENDNNAPQRCKQGNRSRKKKLFDLQRLVLKNKSFSPLHSTLVPKCF
jgi:hypothetical protein